MKIFLTTICALGAILSLDLCQTAKATTEQNFLPNIHLVRGGGRAGGHDFEGRDFGRRDEGAGAEGGGEAASAGHSAMDNAAAAPEDRVHTLDNTGLNTLRNDEGLGDAGWWNGGCAAVDANGNCISYQTN